jgi:hypothetical protein
MNPVWPTMWWEGRTDLPSIAHSRINISKVITSAKRPVEAMASRTVCT